MVRGGAATNTPTASPARIEALRLLHAVLVQRQALDESLATASYAALPARERGFARLLAASTLRHIGQIDALLRKLLREPDKIPDSVWLILRLGVAQLLLLKTPAHAAVSQTVGLLGAKEQGLKGLVNAVLRRASEQSASFAALDARLNMPEWLWQSWVQAYGEPAARNLLQALQQEAPLDLTTKKPATEWAQILGGTVLAEHSVRLTQAGLVEELAGFSDGDWWVQDYAAQLVARCVPAQQGQAVLDLCAAPGGKTAWLAQQGATVTALDNSAPRLQRLQQNMARLKLSADVVCADALAWTPSKTFDAVLLDAPCSGTGIIRRHPDLPWLKSAADITRLCAMQQALLKRAAGFVAQGGSLVYAVCSLQPEEGAQQIAAFLAQHPNFSRSPIMPAEIDGRTAFLTPLGELHTRPDLLAEQIGCDGFYAARLKKH